MKPAARISHPFWIVLPLAALGVLLWADTRRVQRMDAVSALTAEGVADDSDSPTGHAGGVRSLLIPEHNNGSMQWIAQTQEMLARSAWRLRHVDYDNAPGGREVRSASAYRWWIAGVSWFHHLVTGMPRALSVERAALYADPVLHGFALLFFGLYAWRHFGAPAATLVSWGFVMLFPFAGAFLPGQPGDQGLALACALASVLPLVAGESNVAAGSRDSRRRSFACAGIWGGIGLWINVRHEAPILIGIVLGALLGAWDRRPRRSEPVAASTPPAPWRTWAIAGAVTIIALYAVEYLPNHLDLAAWRLEEAHPLYPLAWIGLGELLARVTTMIERRPSEWNRRAITRAVLAALAITALPVALVVSRQPGFLAADDLAQRLTNLAGSPNASNLAAWFAHDASSAMTWATLLPLGLGLIAVWHVMRNKVGHGRRAAAAIALGPLIVAVGVACARLRWWSTVDALLLPLAVAAWATAQPLSIGRRVWPLFIGTTVVLLLPGFFVLLPSPVQGGNVTVTASEVQDMIERDLAHWLAAHAGPEGAIVLAPPGLTVSLYYYGGLRGLGTPHGENQSGFAVAVRILAATSADEAQALVNRRQVTHIVMPSWDTFLDEYARLGSNQPEHTLVGLLHQWLPPRWLRPVAYDVPAVEGFARQSVTIFEVVAVQDNATALSRLAEYFVDMGMNNLAIRAGEALERSFPTDPGAIIASAQVAIAARDNPKLAVLIKALMPVLQRGDARDLPWDRRVSLALVLAQAAQADAARTEIQRCVDELDADRLRSLSTRRLYQFHLLAKSLRIVIPDPQLEALAHELLPVEMRTRL